MDTRRANFMTDLQIANGHSEQSSHDDNQIHNQGIPALINQHKNDSTNYFNLELEETHDLSSEDSTDSTRPPYIHYVDNNKGETASLYNPGEMTFSTYNSTSKGIIYANNTSDYAPIASFINAESLKNAYYIQEGILTDDNGLIVSPNSSRDTVQWLIDNYEVAEAVSLPRSTLYNHYMRYCSVIKIEPINAASFGKLIRSVFVNIRTRRLGTRGNSKYHYYGIRVKPSSYLANLVDDSISIEQSFNKMSSFNANLKHPQFMGNSNEAVPIFPDINFSSFSLSDDFTEEDIDNFRMLYKEHCEAILESVMGFNFVTTETIWKTFWRAFPESPLLNDLNKTLSKEKLHILCTKEPILHFMNYVDHQFYQNLIDILIPDVLRAVPGSMTHGIRSFSKNMENWLHGALKSYPEEIIQMKMKAINAFAQTLKRYTSLNHLAQAGRAVFQNTIQISQMSYDINKVDFNHIKEEARWIFQCDDNLLALFSVQFKSNLSDNCSLEQWADWLESIITEVLFKFQDKDNVYKTSRSFLLKWSFFCSLIIRDLTLRSASSFGSFHLIRLLFEDYLFYLVEHKIANITGEIPISVINILKRQN